MSDITNPLQNTSYTNKDFTSIYIELLNLTKQLAATWDPTISNESDPGVVLLKLNAIIGDKLSYNSDTNVLELFPLSVTQEKNARQLFEQLGYYMHWYKGAITNVAMTWIGSSPVGDEPTEYTIPAFTMVSDYNNAVTYTLIGPVDGTTVNTYKVADQMLKRDGSTTAFKAIQGIPVQYTVAGDPLITVNNLDSDNRLYFTTTDIAENGIFITNVGANNYTDWKKVDNLLVQTLSSESLCYKFGVSQDTSTCYLEFPENAEQIFKNGINITYIKTLGEEGNVAYRTIEKFYTELSPKEDTTITLNTNNVKILNYSSAINGKDPQTINNAYKGYKSTVGTFETLVTLRDYIGYIYNSGLVSNDFVCDRTNDPQVCYNVMTQSNDIDQIYTMIEGYELDSDQDDPKLLAFDLKLFLLQLPTQELNNAITYASTFNLLNTEQQSPIKTYINDIKCISHDYADILPIDEEHGLSHFCMFKNKYPISCKISTQYALTKAAANELVTNVREALYKALNSAEMTFGEEVSYDFVYKTISEADDRIKNVMLDNIEYTTYAVIYKDKKFIEIEISSEDDESIEVTQNFDGDVIIDEERFVSFIGYHDYNVHKFTFISGNNWNKDGTTIYQQDNFIYYGITLPDRTFEPGDYFTVDVSLKTQLRDELYTKSVLAGVTQFFVQDEEFDYKLDQLNNSLLSDILLKNIDKVKTNVDIELTNEEGSNVYDLREHESIQLYSPNILNGTNYSTYVKFEYKLDHDIPVDADYQLGANEWIIFYWKESTEDTYYKYAVYGKGNIVRLSNFDLKAGNQLVYGNSLTQFVDQTTDVWFTSSDIYNGMTYTISQKIANITNPNQLLSTTKSITIRLINQVQLQSSDTYCYWILNETITEEGLEKYRLFEKDGEFSYMLGSGEYFIYTNNLLTNLTILGAGTLIERSDNSYTWEVEVKDKNDVVLNGINAFTEDEWFKIVPSNCVVTLTEQKYNTVSYGQKVKVQIVKNVDQYLNPTTESNIENDEQPTPLSIPVVVDYDKFVSNIEITSNSQTFEFKYNKTDNNWAFKIEENQYEILQLYPYGIDVKQAELTGNTTYSGNIIINSEKFNSGINNYETGTYTFTYDGTYWDLSGSVSINDIPTNQLRSVYGITIDSSLIPVSGDIIEIEYNKIGNNAEISITIASCEIKIDNSGFYYKTGGVWAKPQYGLNDFKIQYTDLSTGNWIELEKLQLNNSDYSWKARTLLGIDTSNIKEQVLLSNQSVITNSKNYYCNIETIDTQDIENNNHYITIPDSDPVSYYMFNVTSTGYLVYDSITKKLYLNDTEILFTENDTPSPGYSELIITNTYVLEGENMSEETGVYPITFMTSINLTTDGNQEISTYTLDDNLNIKYLDFYVYEKYISNNSNVIIQDNGEIDITFTPQELTVELPMQLRKGSYILPLTIGNDELTNSEYTLTVYEVSCVQISTGLSITSLDAKTFAKKVGFGTYTFTYDGADWKLDNNDVDLLDYGITISGTPSNNDTIIMECIYVNIIEDSDVHELQEKKKYYLKINVLNPKNTGLVFKLTQKNVSKELTKNVPIILSNIYKYYYPKNMSSFQATKIANLIKYWDKKRLYNYTYVVDEDEEISNPLDGKTFFFNNHIYNNFTIPQMMSNTEINVLGKM